ncbi:MAG: ABC transporter substrate-binding protein [Bacteroidales bacterium]|nr:ABC transporter substrate-binding protein [Bacteroidales bacterium]
MMPGSRIIFYVLLMTVLFTGCNRGNRTKAESDAQDSIKHLAVTNSDAFEMLVGLGAAENIVGINDISMRRSFFDKSRKWPSIGGNWRNPNVEAMIALKPDIVIGYKRWIEPEGFEDKLKPFHISVERVSCYYMSEYHSDLSLLASLVGKESRADTMIRDFDRIVNMVKNAVTDMDVKRKAYIEYSDFTAMGAGSSSNEMLELIGAVNIASKLGIQYPKVSTEWLLEENPDVIIKVVSADTITASMYERVVKRAGWDRLDAVKNSRVYLILPELCAGPRAMIGSLYFGKWCYPERFASIDPDSIHAYWMKRYYGFFPDNFVYMVHK